MAGPIAPASTVSFTNT
ncbi:unnamed protein product [Linum tenue]|uniref:Uncharacterized protein n=1 Tax=Linum tenue TaxID=586396 RepID=A0AAV0KX57_9ROSI|nr:unnamed protein product [Linum tenue]